MVDDVNYMSNYKCGPSVVAAQGNTFSTSKMLLTLNPSTLSFSVYDKEANATLSTFSFANLNTELNVLQWTKEQTQAVYGVTSTFAGDSNLANQHRLDPVMAITSAGK
jgi:hypothetical protein